MALVYDFKDIASRMKGDLLPRKEPMPPREWANRRLCPVCHGCGHDLHGIFCSNCIGTGYES